MKLLVEQCTRIGFQVEAATNGAQAISKANSFKPDIVVADIHMHDLDGLSVCVHLRETANKPLNMIVMTGHSNPEVSVGCDSIEASYVKKERIFGMNLEQLCPNSIPRVRST